jgi:hypothetical protein
MRILLPSLLITLVFLIACCWLSEDIQTSEIQLTVGEIVKFHDGYVNTDASLSPEEREIRIAESFLLLEMVTAQELVSAQAIAPLIHAVCERTRSYFKKDASLDPLERRIYIRSCDILIDLVDMDT